MTKKCCLWVLGLILIVVSVPIESPPEEGPDVKYGQFAAVTGTNDDLEDLVSFSNFGYCDGKWWYGAITLGVTSESILRVYSVSTLTGATTLEHSYILSPGNWPHTLNRIICKTWGAVILIIVYIDGVGGATSYNSETYSTDSGSSFTDSALGSWGASFNPKGSDIFNLTNYYTIHLAHYAPAVNGKITIQRVGTGGGASVATIDSIVEDTDGIYGGCVYKGLYYCVAVDFTDGLLHKYSWNGVAANLVDVGSLGLAAPAVLNAETQLYWIQGSQEIIIDQDHFYYRTIGTTTWASVVDSGSTTNGVVWDYDRDGNYCINFIIWKDSIYKVFAGGGIAKIQTYTGNAYVGWNDWFSNGADAIWQLTK